MYKIKQLKIQFSVTFYGSTTSTASLVNAENLVGKIYEFSDLVFYVQRGTPAFVQILLYNEID